MASSSRNITLAIRPRGKAIPTLPTETTINLDDSTVELHKRLSGQTRLSTHRLRIFKGSDGSTIPNNPTTTIEETRLRDQSIIYVKDLGPQIGWRTVFAMEYLGPLIIHPVIYFLLRPYIYVGSKAKDVSATTTTTTTQFLSFTLVMLHFLKRELETFFVHRFSASTMPLFNLFKNSIYYWTLAGINMAYFTYAPQQLRHSPNILTYPAIILFVVAELMNFLTHMRLRSLRPVGSTTRAIPHGLGFDTVTCPNYLYEMLAWIAVWLVNWRLSFWSTGLFVLIATGQMVVWARKKERLYRRQFGGEYRKKRYAMIPGII